jgi:2-keto-4-pentenoate hydratase
MDKTPPPAQLAGTIWSARRAGRTLDADATLGSLSLAAAYDIQHALVAMRVDAGERIIGWKLGYTSQVMREQMGVDRPNFGPLTDWMLLRTDAWVSELFVQPRVEPEIGLRLRTAIDGRCGPVDRQTVALAISEALACLEIVHSTWTGYRFSLEQNTADHSSAGQVVVGPPLAVSSLMDLGAVKVQLFDAQGQLGAGIGSDADGHPLDAVARLAGELAAIDRRLEPGDLVITGGLTAAFPLPPGGRLWARFTQRDAPSTEVGIQRRS